MARPEMRRALGSLILAIFAFPLIVAASEYHGQVTFGGLPVPGATVVATQGSSVLKTVTNPEGTYSFADLPDGHWKIDVEMQLFAPIHAEVDVSPNATPGKWELKLLSLDELKASARTAHPVEPPSAPTLAKKPDASAASNAPMEIPKPPDNQSADGFVVNGSVNNAATSQYSTASAFGNTRSGSKGLYNGGLAAILDNSAFDARPYAVTGIEAPKNSYNRITAGVTLGGPLKIPHLLPRGPNFFAAYQWTRNNDAALNPGLVPTELERSGDLAGLVNAADQPVTVIDPATGLAFPGNQVPVSPQAQALLALYPQPNLAGSSGFNYQAPVLNSTHQDTVQLRLDKSIGRRDQFFGAFNLQSARSGSTNLFDFLDETGTLGINANVNWAHRLTPRVFLFTGYRFSRLRTEITPNFDNRTNISGAAGIHGNDQDPADWGPPALNFSSGIAPLSDAESAFNRNRTDAVTASIASYRRRHNITLGGEFRRQQFNYFAQQNPRGTFNFTAGTPGSTSATGSDLADFLIGIPDQSALNYGNADKYLRQPVYAAYAVDDWRILSVLTINAGIRWDYEAPQTELKGRLANLDLAQGFAGSATVTGNSPVGPVTGASYPTSLVRPDRLGIEPRIGISWRPFPASTVVIRAGYGIYHDTSVYEAITPALAEQAPFSKSLSVQNSASCPLTLANGFNACAGVTPDTFAIDPNYRVGYAQTWQLRVQRDLPASLQLTATYLGIKGTHGAQQFLPNTYPIGGSPLNASAPVGFVYRTSGGNSTRESGNLQLRRRLKSGFTATLQYTYSKSIDDDAVLGGQGYVSPQDQSAAPQTSASTASIAQNWLQPRAERALSTFDQRHLLNLQAQYTSGQGLEGGTLMSGWRGRILKEWTLQSTAAVATGLPETPIYPAAVPGTGFANIIRPSTTGASIYSAANGSHLNAAAYTAPAAGQWGTAGRDSIIGPGQVTLNSSLARTFRPRGKYFLDVRVDSTNSLNHPAITGWNTIVGNEQFGLPLNASAMRSLQTTVRLRF
jgi:hypothetical protein